jgi:hypothetical protein
LALPTCSMWRGFSSVAFTPSKLMWRTASTLEILAFARQMDCIIVFKSFGRRGRGLNWYMYLVKLAQKMNLESLDCLEGEFDELLKSYLPLVIRY